MTNSLFFDTDCLSAFLWINEQSILVQLYGPNIIIPKAVYDELSNPKVKHLKEKVDSLLATKSVSLGFIEINTPEFEHYYRLTNSFDGSMAIGLSEATTLVLAYKNNGIVASNNLRDINIYIKKYNLRHKTTGDILIEAYNNNLITINEGNEIWANMLSKKRKLGANSFSDYLDIKKR